MFIFSRILKIGSAVKTREFANNKLSNLCGVSLMVIAASMVSVSFSVAEEATKLKSIKVTTTTKTEVDLRDAPASVTVITAEELERRPVKDLMEAIRETPSIRLEGRGVGGRKVMTVRGMESHQSLIMIDGKRISMSDNVLGHSDFQFNWIPMDAIERIEIVRGPLSALYGSEALGGVVNIITKAVPEEWGGSVRAQYGIADGGNGGDEMNLGSYVSGPLSDNIGVMVSVNYTDLEKRALKEDPTISEQEGKDILSFFGRLTVKLSEEHRLDFDASIVNEERARDTRSRSGILHESYYDLDRVQYGVGYKGDFENFNVELKGYHSSIEQVNRTDNVAVAATSPQKLSDTAVDGHVTFGLGEMNVITAGGEYRDEKFEHPVLTTGSATITHKALFVQDELSISEDFMITAGVRYDDHELFGSEISPRAFVVFHASDSITLKGGYGHGFKAPTIKQISPEYQFIGFHSFYGNADVNPESSDNFELSVAYEDETFNVKITGFYNKIDDMIVSKCITNCMVPFGKVFSYFNVDEAETKGIESEFKARITDRFTFNFNHVYLKAEDTNTGLELEYRPNHTVNARIDFNNDEWGIASAVRLQYTGSQAIYDSVLNKTKLPAYSMWHFDISKMITETIKVTANVENIGNVRLLEKSDDFGFSERGRVFFLGVNAKF